jgi:hypothetical protein
MNIIEQNELFLVVENEITLYTAKSLEEAQGFIDWKQRSNAGNTPEDCNCNK